MTVKMDNQVINTIRVLAADVVQKANSGHPGIHSRGILNNLGAPMGCAPMSFFLFSRFMNYWVIM